MFCVQVQACGEENGTGGAPLVAESVKLDVQIVSNAGRGVAECRYLLDRDVEDLVACVPSIVCVQGANTQQVKVKHFSMKVISRDGTVPSHSADLTLTKLDMDYSSRTKNLPSYLTVEKSLKRSVSLDDLILYLGHFQDGTTLILKFEFLLQLKLSQAQQTSSASCRHVIRNSIPSKHICYELRHASHVQVTNVSPSSSSLPLTNFNWVYTDRTKQVIQVSYTARQQQLENCTVFSIEMAGNHDQSAYCSCLVQTNSPKSAMEGKYDGIMMLSSRLTRDQMPSAKHLYPSEVVFLVDYSASMNLFIDSVTATLIISIKSLPQGCYFNVVAFGSTFRQLFQESKEYSNSSVKNAIDFVNQQKAALGGTQLLPPLKWIFKTSRKSDTPCQVFIITDMDQEVKDVPYVLSTIKKNRHHVRCHTFGIGSSICESLVNSIAEVSGGQSVIVPKGGRLQTKVMEVLKVSLDPFLMDTRIRWQPPEGYSVVDSTSKSLGTVFCHQTRLAFAFLKRTSQTSSVSSFSRTPNPPVTILGSLDGVEVEIPIAEAILPPLSSLQTFKLASILTQVGHWSKLEDLEIARLLSASRKNSTEDEESVQEPKAKKPRLNGEITSSPVVVPLANEIQKDLLHLSLESGISCPFTFFRGTATDGREVVQALPYKRPSTSSLTKGKNGVIPHSNRKHSRRRHNGGVALPISEPQNIATLAKSTISAFSSSFMNLMNIFSPYPSPMMEGGKTLEDEMELQKSRKTQLFWDESNGEIKYPSSYFQECGGVSSCTNHHTHTAAQGRHHRHHNSAVRNGRCLNKMDTTPSSSKLSPAQYTLDTSSSSDDEEENVTISDSDSDSSVELDWESLPKTREYLPLIQMQLFSGAWSMIHEFSYAVRIPIGEISKLPLLNQQSRPPVAKKSVGPHSLVNSFQMQGNLQDEDKDSVAHFWTTALAVVCFRECFPQFQEEWELIVRKGENWLEQNLDQCAFSWPDVQTMAKELLFRKA